MSQSTKKQAKRHVQIEEANPGVELNPCLGKVRFDHRGAGRGRVIVPPVLLRMVRRLPHVCSRLQGIAQRPVGQREDFTLASLD